MESVSSISSDPENSEKNVKRPKKKSQRKSGGSSDFTPSKSCSSGERLSEAKEPTKVVEGKKEKQRFTCPLCKKTFKQAGHYRRHEALHSRKGLYKCIVCEKSVRDKVELERHMRTHTGERPFKCSECGKRFINKAHLTVHERFHTGVKPFPCAECGKQFVNKTQLTTHQRTHTGLKPHKCPECLKSFCRKNHLNRHLRIHTGEKPFKLITLQTRWKGLRDCFKRYLRKNHEGRSGSGSKKITPYIHADEMEFVRPFMELRETQSSWEEPEHAQQGGGEAACALEAEAQCPSLGDSVEDIHDTNETETVEPSTQNVEDINLPEVGQQRADQPATCFRRPTGRSSRPITQNRSQNMERFASLMEKLNDKLESMESEEGGFGIMVAGMLKKVPRERQAFVRKAVIDLMEANMINQSATAPSPIFGPPPPSGPYYDFHNPPQPRSQSYYTPRYRPYIDNFGNAITHANDPIPYPLPSPIVQQAPVDLPPTPSPRPSCHPHLLQDL